MLQRVLQRVLIGVGGRKLIMGKYNWVLGLLLEGGKSLSLWWVAGIPVVSLEYLSLDSVQKIMFCLKRTWRRPISLMAFQFHFKALRHKWPHFVSHLTFAPFDWDRSSFFFPSTLSFICSYFLFPWFGSWSHWFETYYFSHMCILVV